jgi:hypothetical protein
MPADAKSADLSYRRSLNLDQSVTYDAWIQYLRKRWTSSKRARLCAERAWQRRHLTDACAVAVSICVAPQMSCGVRRTSTTVVLL